MSGETWPLTDVLRNSETEFWYVNYIGEVVGPQVIALGAES